MKSTIILLLIVLLSLNACTTSNKTSSDRFDIYNSYISQNSLISKSEIYSFKFRSWNPLDNYHLILTSSHRKAYLITLKSYCNDLTFKPQIYFDQAIDNRLSSHFDSVVVPSEFSNKCAIKSIHIIDKIQKKELLDLASSTK